MRLVICDPLYITGYTVDTFIILNQKHMAFLSLKCSDLYTCNTAIKYLNVTFAYLLLSVNTYAYL